jgi:hypothetical protein
MVASLPVMVANAPEEALNFLVLPDDFAALLIQQMVVSCVQCDPFRFGGVGAGRFLFAFPVGTARFRGSD